MTSELEFMCGGMCFWYCKIDWTCEVSTPTFKLMNEWEVIWMWEWVKYLDIDTFDVDMMVEN